MSTCGRMRGGKRAWINRGWGGNATKMEDAMRIVKRGEAAKDLRMVRFSCPECGCIFDAENMECDIKHLYMPGAHAAYCTAVCPWCGSEAMRRVEMNEGEE